MKFSYSEENYIKAIYHLSNGGEHQVSTNDISERLNTRPASVSDMIRKLSDKGVLSYVKYQGVNITDIGKRVALGVIRKHRLWEVFLVNTLKFQWDEVHDVAEQLEHINSPLLIQRLDDFLEFPKFDPHGDPIPDENGDIIANPRKTLTELEEGESGKLVALKDTGVALLQYLDRINLHLGDPITILEKVDYDGSVIIEIKGIKSLSISNQVAENLLLDV